MIFTTYTIYVNIIIYNFESEVDIMTIKLKIKVIISDCVLSAYKYLLV